MKEEKKFDPFFINTWKKKEFMIVWLKLSLAIDKHEVLFVVALFGIMFGFRYNRKFYRNFGCGKK